MSTIQKKKITRKDGVTQHYGVKTGRDGGKAAEDQLAAAMAVSESATVHRKSVLIEPADEYESRKAREREELEDTLCRAEEIGEREMLETLAREFGLNDSDLTRLAQKTVAKGSVPDFSVHASVGTEMADPEGEVEAAEEALRDAEYDLTAAKSALEEAEDDDEGEAAEREVEKAEEAVEQLEEDLPELTECTNGNVYLSLRDDEGNELRTKSFYSEDAEGFNVESSSDGAETATSMAWFNEADFPELELSPVGATEIVGEGGAVVVVEPVSFSFRRR